MTAVLGISCLAIVVTFGLWLVFRKHLHFRKTLRQIRRLPVREPKRRARS